MDNSTALAQDAITTLNGSDQTQAPLYGDLSVRPPDSRRLVINDVFALDWLSHQPCVSSSESVIIQRIISDRIQMLEQELAEANPKLNARIHKEVHHQLRARPDFQSGELVCEQWVPALDYWLIVCRWPADTDWNDIILQLQEGDPRFKSARDHLIDERARAKARRAAIDAAHSDKITGIISNMSETQRARFLEVERALKTGETIVAHGPDLEFVEQAYDKTKKAAETGDLQAQSVLSGGVVDDRRCFNPNSNPIRR